MSAAVDWDALRRKFDPTGATGRAVANRQAEAVFCGSMRPDPGQQRRALPIIEPEKHTDPAPVVTVAVASTPTPAATVKIWALLGLVAIQNNRGGAWRCWALAKSLDRAGSGWILRSDLVGLLRSLQVGDRKRRRWMAEALDLGLFRERRGVLSLAGLTRAAVLLGADTVGKPATIGARSLVREGWRAHVWAAYEATNGGRPISQAVKEQITGVDPRTQRNYQAAAPGHSRSNFCDRGRGNSLASSGAKEATGLHVFFYKGRNIQRLPNARHVPAFVSTPSPKGRSRKAQKALKLSFSVEREKGRAACKLFHETPKGTKGVLHKLAHEDYRMRPDEVFVKVYAGRQATSWRPVAVGGVY